MYASGPCDLGHSNCNIGVGQTYGCWVLGPLGICAKRGFGN